MVDGSWRCELKGVMHYYSHVHALGYHIGRYSFEDHLGVGSLGSWELGCLTG